MPPERTGITRGDRACAECRRMKVRCMLPPSALSQPGEAGGAGAACRRCQHLGVECLIDFSSRRRKRGGDAEGEGVGVGAGGGKRANTATRTGQAGLGEPSQGFEGYETPRAGLMRHSPAGSHPSLRGGEASYPQAGPSSAMSNSLSHSSRPDTDRLEDAQARSSSHLPPDDPLASEHLVAPFRRLRSNAEVTAESRANSPDRSHPPSHTTNGLPTDRAQHPTPSRIKSRTVPDGVNVNDIISPPNDAMLSILLGAVSSRPAPVRDFSAFQICPEDEAKQLYDEFMAHCDVFVLCHDSHDTYESLRARSPAGLAAVIAMGALARDGPKVISETQRRAMGVAHAYILGSMFARTHTLEDLQAAITIAVYHRNCWLLIGHAIRLATDMGVDTAFSKLIARGMGTKSGAAETERDLVIGARLWLALYSHEAQMSFGDGRTPIIRATEGLGQCRRFLDHPLSTPSDVRLVALVELLVLREPLHTRLSLPARAPNRNDLINLLMEFRTNLNGWYAHYDGIMSSRLGRGPETYYRESLRTQKEYASLFANSLLLRDIASASDLRRLTDEEYILALSAVRSAQTCLDIVVNGQSYPKNLVYAIPHTRLSVAFAASFLLRTGRLFPERIEYARVLEQVEGAIGLLERTGAGRLGRALRFMRDRLGRAEDQGAGAELKNGVNGPNEHSGRAGQDGQLGVEADGQNGLVGVPPQSISNAFDGSTIPDFDLAFGLGPNTGLQSSNLNHPALGSNAGSADPGSTSSTGDHDFAFDFQFGQFESLFDPAMHPLSFGSGEAYTGLFVGNGDGVGSGAGEGMGTGMAHGTDMGPARDINYLLGNLANFGPM